MKAYIWISCLLFLLSCQAPPEPSNSSQAPDTTSSNTINYEMPDWAQSAIWYQVFVERFRNGDPSNDPTLENIRASWPLEFPADWKVSEWTSDWYTDKEKDVPGRFYSHTIQRRRYGGDLQGLLNQLDYIESLGINALYLNPVNDAQSLHKFDARNYRHIDINFGPDPEGDRQLIASENPLDPATWKWTSADLLFLQLIKELHQRDMRLIIDYSWNHTGTRFWAWEDIQKNGKDSPFAHWYEIQSFDDPATEANEFKYTGWAGVAQLPELKKVEVENRVHGKTYKGNLHPDVKAHIFNVTKRWLDPNGDGNPEDGIDGFRLDVADQIGVDFWKDYRTFVRSIHPEALLVGEVWWEEWPDKLMDPRPYVNGGDIFDIIMFYQAYKPARRFFAKTFEYAGAEGLQEAWQKVTTDLSEQTVRSMMMMSASHDSPRLLTSFANKSKYKYQGSSSDVNPNYQNGPPSAEILQRVKLYLAYQFTMPGAPQIWAGDEMGMWGGDDPECRKPLWWNDLTFENESADPFKPKEVSNPIAFNQSLNDYYKKMTQLRNRHPVFSKGTLRFVHAKGDLLAFERQTATTRTITLINNGEEALTLPDALQLKGKNLLSDKQSTIQPKELAALSVIVLLLE